MDEVNVEFTEDFKDRKLFCKLSTRKEPLVIEKYSRSSHMWVVSQTVGQCPKVFKGVRFTSMDSAKKAVRAYAITTKNSQAVKNEEMRELRQNAKSTAASS